MAISVGRVYLNGCNYELAYDLLGQNVAGNYSTVRLYGILHVTNNYISWSRGSASVHTHSNGIGTYYSRGDYNICVADFNWGHDNNGNFSMWVGASLSTTFVSGDTGGTITLPRIPRYATMTNAISSVNDESNPWFTFSNPANSSMSCWLEVNPNGAHLATRNFSGTSGTYTWTLTENERNQLRNQIPNKNNGTIRIGLYSTIGGSTQASYIDRSFSIVNANPTFSNFEFEDINPVTLALTGNNKYNINNYSTIQFTIPVANKAVANKGASMNKYRIAVNNITKDLVYSSTNDVVGEIDKTPVGNYNIYAVDSRGNTTLVTKLATRSIDYQEIFFETNSCKVERNNNRVGKTVKLTYKGTFWNGNFGAVDNSLVNVNYQFKETGSDTWITGTTDITPTISEKEFLFTGDVRSDAEDYTFDVEKSYNFRVIIQDKLMTKILELTPVGAGIPSISLGQSGVGIMGAYDESLGGLLQIGGKVFERDIYSETETIVGKWKDGNPVYRKVISTSINASGNITINHNISNLKNVVNIYGNLLRNDNSQFIITRISSDSNDIGINSINSTRILLYIPSAFGTSITEGNIIVEYTKTTD